MFVAPPVLVKFYSPAVRPWLVPYTSPADSVQVLCIRRPNSRAITDIQSNLVPGPGTVGTWVQLLDDDTTLERGTYWYVLDSAVGGDAELQIDWDGNASGMGALYFFPAGSTVDVGSIVIENNPVPGTVWNASPPGQNGNNVTTICQLYASGNAFYQPKTGWSNTDNDGVDRWQDYWRHNYSFSNEQHQFTSSNSSRTGSGTSANISVPSTPTGPTEDSVTTPPSQPEGQAWSYDLDQHWTASDGGAITYNNLQGAPTGISIVGTNLECDGTTPEGNYPSITYDAVDSNGTTTSTEFSITITAALAPTQDLPTVPPVLPEGQGWQYDLEPLWSASAGGGALSFDTLTGAPTGISIVGTELRCDGTTPEGTTNNVTYRCVDSNGSTVSLPFTIAVQAALKPTETSQTTPPVDAQGEPWVYDLDQHWSSSGGQIIYSGLTNAPAGIVIAGTNLVNDGTALEGTYPNVFYTATDDNGNETSTPFTIVVDPPVSATLVVRVLQDGNRAVQPPGQLYQITVWRTSDGALIFTEDQVSDANSQVSWVADTRLVPNENYMVQGFIRGTTEEECIHISGFYTATLPT